MSATICPIPVWNEPEKIELESETISGISKDVTQFDPTSFATNVSAAEESFAIAAERLRISIYDNNDYGTFAGRDYSPPGGNVTSGVPYTR
jgi:hypothetical protein